MTGTREPALPEKAVRDPVEWIDERVGASPLIAKVARYVFPDHWSFMLGEIALYAFVFLIASGTYLALFFVPDTSETVYHGSYLPLQGLTASHAYISTVGISYDVPAGLLLRQAHHWAALVFIAAIVVHLMRVFFTGAFRKPRDLNWVVGVTLLGVGILEGFCGYSLPDDLLSGMGLVIAYGVAMSIPLVGANFSFLIWGGQFPGATSFEPRLFAAHIFILPALMAALIAAHLVQIVRQHHSQFRGPRRREDNVVGSPAWPGYALRSLGLLFAVFAVLVLLGGLVQINPVWQWGPFEPWRATNGAQPDWFLGWLIGGLRLMPPIEIRAFGHTLVPNPFFAGVLFPTAVFALLYSWPWIERRITGDHRSHDLLDRPRDAPWRTAFGAAFFTWIFTIFVAGAADRILVSVGIPYESQVWFFRGVAIIAPVVVGGVALHVCRELERTGAHPLAGVRVRRPRPAARGYDGEDPG